MENLGWLVLALALGITIGAIATWLLARARLLAAGAVDSAATDRAKAEVALAHSQASEARSEASQVRAEHARLVSEAALAREDAAQARTEAATALAEVAAVQAAVARAEAQREAAVRRAEELAADRESLLAQFKVLSAEAIERQGKQADAAAEQRLKATELLMAPVKDSLERFNSRLTEVEKERAAMSADLRRQVAEVKFTGEQLRRETSALVTALRKPQVRGAWGELQLKRVAEVAGMLEHCDFVLQETSQTSAGATIRPDMKVTLAEGKFVYVDSKVPLSAFLDAHETDDDGERERRLAQFAKNVQGHVDQLSSKSYFKADTGTPEFVVLFLPSEALAAEALMHLPDLHEYAARRNIVLATPTTLIAMLRAVAYSWRQAALADSAQQVFALGRELYDRLGTLGKHFDKVGRSLQGAVNAYNDAVGSIEGRVFPTARKLKELKVVVAEKEAPAVNPTEATVRQLTATELVEDAAEVAPMIGRGRALPPAEAAHLVRPQPSLEELLSADSAGRSSGGSRSPGGNRADSGDTMTA